MTADASILRDRAIALPLAAAALAATVVWVFADPAEGRLAARAFLGAGLALWSFDSLRQAHYAVTPSNGIGDPHRWTHAALQAAAVAAIFQILFGATTTGITGALVGAAIAGALWLAAPGNASAAQPGWDTARPMTSEPLRRRLYHFWPALALVLLAGLVLAPPEDGWNPTYVMFQAAFLPFLLPLYPSKGRFLGTAAERLRMGGLLLLVAGVWVGTS